jgi:RNA polymerase sigma factor (sigma-70 family)
VCKRYLNTDDSQDALQETYITIFNKIDTYTSEGVFEGWCRKIAVNICLQKLRKKEWNFSADDIDNIQISDTEIYEQDIYIDEQVLQIAINNLPEIQKVIVNMAIVDELSHKEIAKSLNITEENSRVLLLRAKSKLKAQLIQVKHG